MFFRDANCYSNNFLSLTSFQVNCVDYSSEKFAKIMNEGNNNTANINCTTFLMNLLIYFNGLNCNFV